MPIPAKTQLTTWLAEELGGNVLPAVGMQYRDAEEQALIDEIVGRMD